MAQHGDHGRWLLERLDTIAERREQRRLAQQKRRTTAAARRGGTSRAAQQGDRGRGSSG